MVRKVTPFRPYICTACNWRGWMRSGRKMKKWRTVAVLTVVVVSLVAVLAFFYQLNDRDTVAPSKTPAQRRR